MYLEDKGGAKMDPVRIRYISEEISQLPKGNITYKTINGKKYPYLQWSENGKQKTRIVKSEELQELKEKITQRKSLEKKVKELQKASPIPVVLRDELYFSLIKRSEELKAFASPVTKYKKREIYKHLEDYIYGNETDKVFILYGLRRTGKTTMIRQLISEMSEEMLKKSAYIQITPAVDLAKINLDLRALEKQGCKYIFIDEVTLMNDFIEGAALFSDIFASSGMKIVLSGTDSLGFVFSENQQLYDRCKMLHTTFIPYREFENVLGITGIDEYIRHGGTMSLGGIDYNKSDITFATKKSTDEYIDSAIASNIQHSLKNYDGGSHFRQLSELYTANELTSAINRIVEDINHEFTIEVLTKEFKSHDFGRTERNLLKDKKSPNTILQQVDKEKITQRLRQMLEIRNLPEQTVKISDVHRSEIKEYLDMLDLTVDIDILYLPDIKKKDIHTTISQPGMRYAQAEALIQALIDDEIFMAFSLSDRNVVKERILSDIMGYMMEDIVLLETKKARPDCQVFKLIFATGEFDMVIFDPISASCEIYEIKHSDKTAKEQYRHLIDPEKCEKTEFRYGPVTGKYVIYRGKTQKIDKIQYINVEEYLNGLECK